jgi:hypothetical protein
MQDQTDAGVEAAAGDAGAARYTMPYCYICVLVLLCYTAIYARHTMLYWNYYILLYMYFGTTICVLHVVCSM